MPTGNKNGQHEILNLNQLLFDPKNPRFSGLNEESLRKLDDNNFVIEKMIAKQNISDLVISIGDQGYFDGEPLLVFKDRGSYIVAEGNRRLAALNILNHKFQGGLKGGLKEIVNNAQFRPVDIPCIVFNNRSDILHYLGYKHITGVKSWGALEKAIYLEQLKKDLYDQDNSKTDEDLHKILAREIGSQAPAIAKSLTALSIYNVGFEENNNKFFGLQRVSRDEVEFSLIYTALGYKNLYEFIGLASGNDVSLNDFNSINAKELFNWMFAETDDGYRLVKESRQLSILSHVVSIPEALSHFRKNRDLDYAYLLSSGPDTAFQKNIDNISKSITQLQSFVSDLAVNKTHIKNLENLADKIDDVFVVYKNRLKKQRNNDE